MTDDATLTDFVGGESNEPDESEERDPDDSGGSADDSGGSARDSGGSVGDTDIDVTPETDPDSGERDADALDATERPDAADGAFDTGLSTYGWGEYTCSRCGDGVDRVWREDGDLVCPDCKSW